MPPPPGTSCRTGRPATPWLTPLPFPVQVVDKVETIDHVGRTKRVATYRYHHGHYDGREREFCGFGRVDQFDTESFEDFSQTDPSGDAPPVTNGDRAHYVPPVETRSWFHTGVYFDEAGGGRGATPLDYRDLTARFRQEYYSADDRAVPLDEHDVETGETPAEAYRALRGAQLRTELYAHDGSERSDHPYQVSESRYRVAQLQPRSADHHAVHFSHQLESLTYHYERNPADPRISHGLTLAVDAFGNPLKTMSVAYGRRQPDQSLPTQADRDRQARTLITFTEARFTNAIDDPARADAYRAPAPSETLTHELTGFEPLAPDAQRFSYAEWVADDFARIDGAPAIGYEEAADPAVPQKRLIERMRTVYRADDLTDLLPLGVLEPLALPGESLRLAFTAGLLTRIYGARVDDSTLVECGFVRGDDPTTWWIPSGRVFYSPGEADTPADELAFAQRHFFATHRTRDPFGNSASTRGDPYVLLTLESTDAVGNRTVAEQDYRVLQPFRLTDPNGNRAEVAFDTLGFVAGSAVSGKATETLGDSLAGFAANLSPEQRLGFLADPLSQAAPLLGTATTRIVYDLERFQREQQPVCVSMLTRETHVSDALPADGLKVQLSLSYSDGFGREIQKKIPAEPGPVVDGGPVVSPRWVGSGWTIFNNKGKPVKQVRALLRRQPRIPLRSARGCQLHALLRPDRAGGRHAASRSHLGEGGVRPMARSHLGRQRHRADRQAERRPGRRRFLRRPGPVGVPAHVVRGAGVRRARGRRAVGGAEDRRARGHPFDRPRRCSRTALPHHRPQQVRAKRGGDRRGPDHAGRARHREQPA